MSDTAHADALQEAVTALLTKGYTVESGCDDPAMWYIDGSHIPYSDDEVITYAYTLGLTDPPAVMQ